MNAINLAALLCLGSAALGCTPQAYRIEVAPSLRPIDPARTLVVFSQIQGQACGRDAVLGAIRDMKHLTGVDGYLEVVVEDTGESDKRCAKVTAYPFRYGSSTDEPGLREGDEPLTPLLVPGRAAAVGGEASGTVASGRGADCATACARVAALLEHGTTAQALANVRCSERCARADPTFAACIAAAVDADAARSCMTTPSAQREVQP